MARGARAAGMRSGPAGCAPIRGSQGLGGEGPAELWKRPLDKPSGAVTLTQPVLAAGTSFLIRASRPSRTRWRGDRLLDRLRPEPHVLAGPLEQCGDRDARRLRRRLDRGDPVCNVERCGAVGRGAAAAQPSGPPAPPAPGAVAAPGAAPGAPAAAGARQRHRARAAVARAGGVWRRWRTRWRRREQRLCGLEHGHGPALNPQTGEDLIRRRSSRSARAGWPAARASTTQFMRCRRAPRQCRQRGLRDRSRTNANTVSN